MNRKLALTSMLIATILAAVVAISQAIMMPATNGETPASATQPASGGHVAALEKQAARWSKTVNGLQARLTLKRSHVYQGTTIISTHLHLRNVSGVRRPMKINWGDRNRAFRPAVVDEKGKVLRGGVSIYSDRRVVLGEIVLPHEAVRVFDITQNGFGVLDKAGVIDLGSRHSWVFERDGKDYYLQAVIEVPAGKAVANDDTFAWHGRIEIPPVMVPLKPVPVDPVRAAELIRKLGSEMLSSDGTVSGKARRALSLIEDERVIPWYVKAINTRKSYLKYAALDQLRRFNSDQALVGLKKGMTTQGRDIENLKPHAYAVKSAEGIRRFAAYALRRSPHPGAKQFLLSQWKDPSSSVRHSVVRTLGKMDSAESLRMLEQMSKDSDEGVRKEALRYLKLRTTQPAPTTQPAR